MRLPRIVPSSANTPSNCTVLCEHRLGELPARRGEANPNPFWREALPQRRLHNTRECDDVKGMALIDYCTHSRAVAGAISRLREGIVSAESSEELELLTSRLKKACDVLAKASCKGTSRHDLHEASRLIGESRRLLFVVKVTSGSDEEYPKLHV
jgi:hypothetical protein